MTKAEKRQIVETEAALDGKPIPLRPLERVHHKIHMFRSRHGGVSIRLNPEETDELLLLLRLPSVDHACLSFAEENAILREASRYGVGKRNQ